MSATFRAEGYIDIRIPIDDTIDASQSSSPAKVADLVKMRVECRVGQCEILDHMLKITEV